jgi:hypothetical protein
MPGIEILLLRINPLNGSDDLPAGQRRPIRDSGQGRVLTSPPCDEA